MLEEPHMEQDNYLERMTHPSNPIAYNAATDIDQYLSGEGHNQITNIIVEYDESEIAPTIRTEISYLLEEDEEKIERSYEFSNLTEDETRHLVQTWEETFEETLIP